jgi:ABC-2 type transport system permease protein
VISNLIRKEFKENRWKIIIFLCLLSAIALLITLSYNYLTELLPRLTGQDEITLQGTSIMENPQIYLWSQWSAKNLSQFGIIFAIIIGAFSLAGEVKAGTISFLLTKPISRTRLYIVKAGAGLLQLLLVLLIPTLILILSAFIKLGDITISKILINFLITYSGLITIYCFSLLLSILIDDPIKVGLTAGGGLLVYSLVSRVINLSFFFPL